MMSPRMFSARRAVTLAALCALPLGAACVAGSPDLEPIEEAGEAGEVGEELPGVDEPADDPAQDVGILDAKVGSSARVVGTGGAGLRLRSFGSSNGAVVRVMPEGATVAVTDGPIGLWYRVAYSGSTGWAHGSYLRTSQTGGKNNLLPWTANVAFRVSQGHNGGSHTGTGAWAWDFATPVGTPIRAAHVGTIRRVKGDSNVGGCSSAYANAANYVVVDQGNGYETLYLHLRSVTVGAGQAVNRGDLIGYSGQTGWSCGAHLHFQVQRSPSNGGSSSWYNPSVHDYFYDRGFAYDPSPGTTVTSGNGVSNQPREDVAGTGDHFGDVHDHHGGAGAAWDEVMRGLE